MKILRLFWLLMLPQLLSAQSLKKDPGQLSVIIQNYLQEKQTEFRLSDSDIKGWMISDFYTNKSTSITYVYVHQQVNGVRIFNAVSSVAVKDGKIISFAKKLHTHASERINASKATLSATDAIGKAAQHLEVAFDGQAKLISTDKKLNRTYYRLNSLSNEQIRVELVYQPVKNKLRLAYDVNIRLKDKSHWWNVRIDAITGEFLQKNDWTAHCDFGAPSDISATSSTVASPVSQSSNSSLLPTYRVYPFPIESPNFGSSSLISNPSDAVASPFGWHDVDGVSGPEFTITRGNNVYAYDDIANVDAPGTSPDGTASLTFDFPVNFSQQPVNYLDASITNLFYVNNRVHDILYHNGFDEDAGNFQQNNYSHGGLGNDFVVAECQDGGGTNNANFSTPDDGQSGWMQMYLWTGSVQSSLVINSPGSIAGNYICVPAGFGPTIVTPITANFILVDDANGVTTDACESIINTTALNGKIAVIDRGTCDFVDKVLMAQNAGAVAVVMINNAAGAAFAMGDNGNGGTVTIPSVMVSQADGNLFRNTITGGATVNGTLNPPPGGSVDIDGSLDNGVVVHEYGHGVSNRLTGGPQNSNCLFNAEEGGEGWSDFFALMFSTKVGDLGTNARGMGTFAQGQPANGAGIRRFPYSTDMNINPLTYGDIAASPEVHDIGEIWCMTLWEMNWSLITQFGFDPDWINGTGGNNITLKLVMEGMKLQPCGPGFIDARDAILTADDNLYGGVHKCTIWEAFAKRGMGFNADQGDADVAGDETEDFSLPPLCLVPTAPPIADFAADNTTTCTGIVHFTDGSTNTPQQWNWSFGDGTFSTAQNPTHTYSSSGTFNVTLIVTNTLGGDTLVKSNYITITFPSAPGISGDTTICNGGSTTITANVASGNVAEWRDANDSIVFTGTVFNTPNLNVNTAYTVIQYTPTPIQNVGAANTAIGQGGYHNTGFEGKLNFTTFAPMRLVSVWVDAQSTAARTFNLYQGNTLITAVTQNITAGQGRVTLNMDIPAPGNYSLGVTAGSDLYRNTTGAAYPYTIAGLVSITNSNSTTNPAIFYYYCYDWEVQSLPCSSAPLPVNISVVPGAVSAFSYVATGLTLQFTSNSGSGPVSWAWDFGNGTTSTLENPSVTFSAPGTYPVSLTVVDAGGCQATSTQLVTVSQTGIAFIAGNAAGIYYSNNMLTVKFTSIPDNARIKVYDPIGKLIFNTTFNSGNTFTEILKDISSEFILVNVEDGTESQSKKIILVN